MAEGTLTGWEDSLTQPGLGEVRWRVFGGERRVPAAIIVVSYDREGAPQYSGAVEPNGDIIMVSPDREAVRRKLDELLKVEVASEEVWQWHNSHSSPEAVEHPIVPESWAPLETASIETIRREVGVRCVRCVHQGVTYRAGGSSFVVYRAAGCPRVFVALLRLDRKSITLDEIRQLVERAG